MIDFNSDEISFENDAEVEAYSHFFLKVRPSQASAEFDTQEALDEFNKRRERALVTHLDELRQVDFSKANKQKIEGNFFKIVKTSYANPLSSIGSNIANTRFNFKDISLLKNRSIYFSKARTGCEIELFHLEDQRRMLQARYNGGTQNPDDIISPDYNVYEYNLSLDNILILTSKPCCDAVNIQRRVILNEWYDINYQFDIPTACQVLATMARTYGFKGILYTSTRIQTETNLVLFEENTGELTYEPTTKISYKPSDWLLKPIN